MPTFDYDDVPNWRGRDVIDHRGYAVGTITDIYVDDATGRPEWATVKAGLIGGKSSFVPLSQAEPRGLQVQVPYDRSHIKDAPSIHADGHLDADEEARLYQHYGLENGPVAPGSGPSGADSEFVAPATGTRESGRLRLRRHVANE